MKIKFDEKIFDKHFDIDEIKEQVNLFLDQMKAKVIATRLRTHLGNLYAKMESENKKIDRMIIGKEVAQKMLPVLRTLNEFDGEYDRRLLQTGLRGALWGADIVVDCDVDKDSIELISDPK